MEQDYRLAEGEYRFACLVWANEPLGSGQLVALANEALGWKKSTTYTVLKKLCARGIKLPKFHPSCQVMRQYLPRFHLLFPLHLPHV